MVENIVSKWQLCKSAFPFGHWDEEGYELRQEGYIGFGCDQPEVIINHSQTRHMFDQDD